MPGFPCHVTPLSYVSKENSKTAAVEADGPINSHSGAVLGCWDLLLTFDFSFEEFVIVLLNLLPSIIL